MDSQGEDNYAGAINDMVLSSMVYIKSGGKEFELAETFVPEVDEVIGRKFGDSLARALRRYGRRGIPVLIKKNGKSCFLYTRNI